MIPWLNYLTKEHLISAFESDDVSAQGLSGSNEDRQGSAEGWIDPPAEGRIDTPAEGWNSIVLIKTKPYYPLSYAPLHTYPWLIST